MSARCVAIAWSCALIQQPVRWSQSRLRDVREGPDEWNSPIRTLEPGLAGCRRSCRRVCRRKRQTPGRILHDDERHTRGRQPFLRRYRPSDGQFPRHIGSILRRTSKMFAGISVVGNTGTRCSTPIPGPAPVGHSPTCLWWLGAWRDVSRESPHGIASAGARTSLPRCNPTVVVLQATAARCQQRKARIARFTGASMRHRPEGNN